MKAIPYFVVGLLLLSGFVVMGVGNEAGEQQISTISLNFSNIKVVDSATDSFIELNIDGAPGVTYYANEPMLPMHSEKITLPFGTKILDIECQTGEINSQVLSEKIAPAPEPVVDGMQVSTSSEQIMSQEIYSSKEFYPNNWVKYYTGGGLDENLEHKTFLIIQVFPVRYSPATDTIEYTENVNLKITYQEPETNPFPQRVDFDLVIIAPEKFSSALQPLVTHKENMGVTTLLKTTEDIYDEYTGFDKPEQIKYFIKDALETSNIKYVLLVGGLKSLINANPRENRNEGTKDWYVPVRYTNNREGGTTYDPGFISDLYYADIYDSEGNFSSWDSNSDGVYAKWDNTPGKDELDLYPDVSLSRLACRNIQEVKIVVNKIINYEDGGAYGADWFDKMILIGGDSFDDAGTNYVEGEVAAEANWEDYMDEFTPVRIYASYKTSNPQYTPIIRNIRRELTKGAGHVFFDGHANPASWTTHWPGEFNGMIDGGGIMIYHFPLILNGNKLPILAVEGCHNSQFNVSLIPTMQDKKNEQHYWCYGLPVPECWSWWLVRKIGGGSIATQGNTGLGYGAVGEHGDLDGDGILEPDILEALGGYFFGKFYESIDEGYDMVGDVWAMALTKYQDTFPGMADQTDAKTLCQQLMLGDPSLKIGGYPAAKTYRAEIVDAGAGVVGAVKENIYFKATVTNGQAPYTYEWDLDEDGVYDDAQGQDITYNWNSKGISQISLKVTDANGNIDTYNTMVEIENGAQRPLMNLMGTLFERFPNALPIVKYVFGL